MANNSSMSIPQQSNDGIKALGKLLPVAIAICITNGLVLIIFYRRKSLRTKSNYLLFSLAICDFLTGAINIPYFIVFSFQVVKSAIFYHFQYILHTLMAVSAGYHILMITAEKYLAITRPLKHYLLTKKMVLKIVAGIWITSAVLAVIPFSWDVSQLRLLYYSIHAGVCLVVVFFIPYVFMIYAFLIMFRSINKRDRPSPAQKDTLRLQQNDVNDRKCILVFATMAVIFAFCWLPYFTIMLINNINDYREPETRLSDTETSTIEAIEAFTIIRYVVSITNPLLYTYFKRDFWLEIRSLCFSSGRRRRHSEGTYYENRQRLAPSSYATNYYIEQKTKPNPKEHIVFISSV